MNIRTAERRDLSAMLDIYNYEVKNGTATFDVEPRAGAAGEAWFAAHNTGNHPLLVAEEDGKVLGYASLSPYRDFDAYLQTVELSVYVAPESRGRGIASALMEAVLRLARDFENRARVVVQPAHQPMVDHVGHLFGVQQTAHFVHAALRVARQLIEVADLPIQAALHVGIRFFDAVQKILGVFCGAAFRAAAHIQLAAGKQCVQNAVNIVFHLKSPFSG